MSKKAERAARLVQARSQIAKIDVASDAAKRFGWGISTYLAHENGQNDIRPEVAQKYARAFKVNWVWLYEGSGAPTPTSLDEEIALIVGALPEGRKRALLQLLREGNDEPE